MIFLQLFYIFVKIGLFGFGGGYATISMIQGEVVMRHHWLSAADFTDIVAVSQVTPGAIGINVATYVGYSAVQQAGFAPLWCVLGSLIATLAVVLPSFVIIIAISRFFLKYSSHPTTEAVFGVLRPTVIGLIAAASLVLMSRENFGSWSDDRLQFAASVLIFAGAFVGVRRFRLSPILLTVLAGLCGLLIY